MKVSKCEMTWDAPRLGQNYEMPLVTENRKYSRNSYRKLTENTKGLIESQKLLGRPQKVSNTFLIYF